MTSLKPKLLYQLAISFVYTAVPVVIFPYVSRVLGPAHIGRINFIDYTAQLFILIGSFGIPLYGVRAIARVRDNPELVKKTGAELILIHIVTTVISILLFGVLYFVKRGAFSEHYLVIFALVNLAVSSLGLEWLIQGMEDFKFLARRAFAVKIVSLVLILLLIRMPGDYIRYYFILMSCNLLLLGLDIRHVFRRWSGTFKSLEWKTHLRPLGIFFMTTVGLSIYTYFDTVLLGLITGSLAVGFYTTSLKVIRMSHSLVSDIGGVLMPRVSFLVGSGKNEEASRIINKSFRYVMTLTVPLSVFIFAAADEIITVMGGGKFGPSIPVLRILSILPLILGLTNIFFVQILLPFGREKTLLLGVILGSVLSIVLNLILCPLYQEQGAAFSCLAAEAGVCLFLGVQALRHIALKGSVKMTLGTIICALGFLPAFYFFRMTGAAAVPVIVLAGATGLAFYLLAEWYVFRNEVIREIIRFTLDSLRKIRGGF